MDDSRMASAVEPTAFPAAKKGAWHSTAGVFDPEPAMRWAPHYDDEHTNYRKLATGHRCVRRTQRCPVLASPR
ncbi:hypothetical protein Sipo8835_25765 [Streptomyces ipomoeae]|uniref:Uncharacterized protein n=2 Tax=Streptomyces ipomoeae TaxID=103232 RepID=L1KWY9_9ACTN|nr:hypothetical protein [Streptomyces ipomoeae]EKX65084.1 hypothetical protein STRIP9103_09435 [Streptomyces ipomoeae 91-03]MDX2693624.1 hypothetical protein [Streptomyces ipomoeae]MDX2824700.1 hypothetical protein [Streptomyces ipomoeae]MDX2838127.1 hypothetical protein [Streptomyces ipomoeae]MDX2877456.1 hypothetical protein [Streptomyces ipomoeae]